MRVPSGARPAVVGFSASSAGLAIVAQLTSVEPYWLYSTGPKRSSACLTMCSGIAEPHDAMTSSGDVDPS